jgi:dihydropyrimidinase
MAYRRRGLLADDAAMVKILRKTRDEGMLVTTHAENGDVVDALTDTLIREGKLATWYHYESRPEWVEAEAVQRAIYWAEHLEAPLYIVHNAAKESIDVIRAAKGRGVRVYAETCPQYLQFTNDVYRREDAVKFVCSPCIKGPESKGALRAALADGIDTVATDHCPFTLAEKTWGKDDFTKIPNGCGGTEFLYPYILNLADTGEISWPRAVELCSGNPARIFGCANKGAIQCGKDADIALYNPKKPFTIHAADMHGNSDHTIYEGLTLAGSITRTYLRGKLVYDGGKYVGTPGDGKYVKRERLR